MASPFAQALGVLQGRITSSSAPEGEYVYELGHSGRVEGAFTLGDETSLTQSFAFGAQYALLRCAVVLHTPRNIEDGYVWAFEAAYDGLLFYRRRIEADSRRITVSDIALPLTHSPLPPGTADVTFTLRVEAA